MKTAIILIALTGLNAYQVYGRVKFGPLCSGSTSNTIRGCDIAKYGCGHFGANRGEGYHKALDVVCNDGDTVKAPFDVIMLRTAGRYGIRNAIDDGILLMGEGLCFKLFYVIPDKASGEVKKGQRLGTLLHIQSVYPGITPYVHVQMCDESDPTKYF